MLQIKHKNVIKAYEAFWDDHRFYIFMKYAQGGSLRNLVGKSISEKEILRLLFETAEGLQCIHSHKIIHRDLKPENILLDKHNHVKITDFGESRLIEKSFQPELTFLGTYDYIAPEVWDSDAEVGYTSDVWSLGVIIYELCVGIPPFSGNNLEELKREIQARSTPQVLPTYTKQLRYLIEEMLHKDQRLRISIKTILNDRISSFSIIKPVIRQVPFQSFDKSEYSVIDNLSLVSEGYDQDYIPPQQSFTTTVLVDIPFHIVQLPDDFFEGLTFYSVKILHPFNKLVFPCTLR